MVKASTIAEDKKNIIEALLSAYNSYDDLEMMLDLELNTSLPEIASRDLGLRKVIYKLVKEFEGKGELLQLVKEVHKDVPNNAELNKIYEKYFWLDDLNIEGVSPKNLEDLKKILSKINFDLLKDICEKAIQQFTSDAKSELTQTNSINSILKILTKQYPLKKDNTPTIFEFAQRLYDCDRLQENELSRGEIKNWLLENDRFPTDYPQPQKISSLAQSDTQYIAIVVSEFEPKPNLQFSLCATRFYQDSCEEIDLPSESKTSCFRESELKTKIVSIINDLEKIIYDRFDCFVENTIIELFLPYEEIKNNYDIDFEKILPKGIIKSPEITIGEKYCIVIRCFERYDEQYNYVGYLQKLSTRWQKLQSFLKVQNCGSDEFDLKIDYLKCIKPDKNMDDNKFWKKMVNDWEDNEKISVNLTGFSQKDNSKLDLFFGYIIQIGIPLVLWNRNPDFCFKDVKDKFSSLVNQNSLKELDTFYQEIRKARRDAHTADSPKEEIGYHLGVLFDNPDRIPPCINDRY